MSLLVSESDERLHELRGLASGSQSCMNTESENLLKPRRISKVTMRPTEVLRTLGTFGGVICPVALSQFSTLLFLRMGFVVGQSGLLLTIAQLALAYTILLLTIFSICAISTNGAVEGGGVYFMISRTLGPQFGGAIGILFYLANVCSCALYVTGLVEGLLNNFGPDGTLANGALPAEGQAWHYLYATIITVFCLIVCLIGGSMFAKTSLFILMIVFVVIISVIASFLIPVDGVKSIKIPRANTLVYRNFSTNYSVVFYNNYSGISSETFTDNLLPHWKRDYNTKSMMSFVTVFAILFSSVTGIMNGANMSGELKRPSISIPRGTLVGTCITLFIYLLLTFFVSASCHRRLLIDNYYFLQGISFWPPFIFIGIISTTLSAALGNLIGASRILHALAKDGLFGAVLRPVTKTVCGGNPVVAVVVSFVLVMLINAIGKLNYIAPLVSVCFLLSYASVNLACALLDVASPPNFRPTFKAFHWQTSLLGLFGCVVMCFLINAIYASIALLLFLFLIMALHYRDFPLSWGSISQALLFHQVRKYLLMLDARKDHVKYWRPQILLLVSNPKSAANLIYFVNHMKKGGLYVIGHVKPVDFDQLPSDPVPETTKHWLSLVDFLHIKAFIEMTLAPTVRQGVHHLIRISGLGGMKPNTICLGFYDEAAPVDTLVRLRRLKAHLPSDYGTSSSEELNGDPEAPRRPENPAHRSDHFFQQLEALRGIDDERALSLLEHIAIVRDIIKMRKSVCLARHFEELNPRVMCEVGLLSGWLRNRGSNEELCIDVWPVNFFLPRTVSFLDTTCLFMLQLACILCMVPGWKRKTRLRVFLCVDAHHEDATTIRNKMNGLLSELRIAGETVMVPWDHLILDLEATGWRPDPLTESVLRSVEPPMTEGEASQMSAYREGLGDSYISGVNGLIRTHSANSTVCFCYLPRPPSDDALWEGYHRDLCLLTENMPPTILAHGLHVVTSTAL